MRMGMLKKSYNALKKCCDKEKKQFGELKGADFGKMKLATRIIDRRYYRICDHCPPRPIKKSRGLGRCSGSDGDTKRGSSCEGEQRSIWSGAERRHEQRSMEWATWRNINERHGAPTMVCM